MENLCQKGVDSSMKKNFFTIILLGIFTSNLFAGTVTCTKLSDCLNQGYKIYEKNITIMKTIYLHCLVLLKDKKEFFVTYFI